MYSNSMIQKLYEVQLKVDILLLGTTHVLTNCDVLPLFGETDGCLLLYIHVVSTYI